MAGKFTRKAGADSAAAVMPHMTESAIAATICQQSNLANQAELREHQIRRTGHPVGSCLPIWKVLDLDPRQDVIGIDGFPERAFYTLLAVVAVLAFTHSVVNFCWVTQACGPLTDPANSIGHLFNLNAEMNVPTWFSISILLLVSVFTLPIALYYRRKGEPTLAWWGIFFVFLLLSLDEGSDLHGALTGLVKNPAAFGLHNALFSWVIPGAVIVLVFGAFYLRWVFRLPKRTRWLIIGAGTIYVGGALMLEAVGGLVADNTYLNPGYLVISTLEETFEMTGIVLMIYALLDHARQLGLAFAF